MVGTIFQIVSVEKSEENYWRVQLNYVADSDLDNLKAIKQQFIERIVVDKGPHQLTWGRFLYHVGEYDKAANHYEMWLKNLGNIDDNELLATIHNDLGLIYYQKKNYAKANEHHTLAFAHAQASHFPLDLTVFYDNQGGNQTKLNEYSNALNMYQRALRIEERRKPISFSNIARLYSNMGIVYYHQRKFSEALDCLEAAFKGQRCISLKDSNELATTCNNLGNVYTNMDNHLKAEKFYLEAYKTARQSLPEDHPTVQLYLENWNMSHDKLFVTSNSLDKASDVRKRRNSDISVCQINIQSPISI